MIKAGEVRRAQVILRLVAGQSYRTIMKHEGCGQDFVARWKERFRAERLAGLYARHRGKIVSENAAGHRRPESHSHRGTGRDSEPSRLTRRATFVYKRVCLIVCYQ